MFRKFVLTVAILSLPHTPIAWAGDDDGHRQLDAHEHGHGTLNIAVEGETVTMELEAPGADIVGFEYAAKSDEDKAKIEQAKVTLAKPLKLFQLSAAASCKVTSTDVELHQEKAETEKADGHDEHDDHGDDKDHAEEKAGHTEFHANYVLKCKNPGALAGIGFPYFDNFSGAKELDVNLVTEKGQNKFEVERDTPELSLAGMI